MIRILFVCLGNICRSPTAEGVFRHKLHQNGYRDGYLENIFVDSAGTGDWHVGQKPDQRSRETALKYGVDLDDLRARQITRQDFSDFDYLVAMDRENIRNMKALSPPDQHHKIALLMDYTKDCPGISEVPDPYCGGMDGFDRVYEIIERGCDGFLKNILTHYDLRKR